jgi:DNA-binding response OmpR family regulator
MATVPLGTKRASDTQLRGRTILIVEDEPIVALHLHASLHEVGAGLIAATSAEEALRLIRRNDVSAAILDVRLGSQDCFPVCQELSNRRIPFAFHTGHSMADIFEKWPQAPVFLKPTPVENLVAGVAALVAVTNAAERP